MVVVDYIHAILILIQSLVLCGYYVGHSLGGALADLTYLSIKLHYRDTQVKITTFGQPRLIFTVSSSSGGTIGPTADELLWDGDSKKAYVQGKVRQSSGIAYFVSILGTRRLGEGDLLSTHPCTTLLFTILL